MHSKNNLGSQKLIKGEIEAVHLAHLPSVKDNSDCGLELHYSRCATDPTGCVELSRAPATCPRCSLPVPSLQ